MGDLHSGSPSCLGYYPLFMFTDSKNIGTADIAELFQKGLRLYQEGRLQQAQDICHSILKKQRHPSAMLILAMTAHQQGQYESSDAYCREFLDHFASHEQAPGVAFIASENLYLLGRYEQAIEAYSRFNISGYVNNIEDEAVVLRANVYGGRISTQQYAPPRTYGISVGYNYR